MLEISKGELRDWLTAFTVDAVRAFSLIPHDVFRLLRQQDYLTPKGELSDKGWSEVSA